jgi:N,N-dimethylformamidase
MTQDDRFEPHGLMGYLDVVSAAPGSSVQLHVASTTAEWSASVVRLLCADLAPEGPPLREEPIDAIPAVQRASIEQRTPVGSYVTAPVDSAVLHPAAGLTIRLAVMPSLPGDGDGPQAIVAHQSPGGTTGWALQLDERGAPQLRVATTVGTAAVTAEQPLVRGCWYAVEATIDVALRTLSLGVEPIGPRAASRVWIGRGEPQRSTAPLPGDPIGVDGPVLLACGWLEDGIEPRDRFDGRISAPTLLDTNGTTIAAWDFAASLGPHGVTRPSHLHDAGPHGWHGTAVNHPQYGVTGPRFDGTQVDFRHAPDHYDTAHFHRDDMTDCRWIPQAELELPADLRSGVYAVRLTATDGDGTELVDHVPFVVRPPAQTATAPLLLVLPTNSYLAYANDHVGVDSPRSQMMIRRVVQFDAFDRFRHHHRELGASLYEAHPDGNGICFSSWRRPILTMRPQIRTFNGRTWQFTGDLQLVDWLDRHDQPFDVISDRDLHDGGAELLARYACVMTGTHPEYFSGEMLDALGDYVDGGGRLMYMGGNGLYWATGYDPEDDQVIEIRRWAGSQAWQAKPGEYHLSFTGEPGGLWRNRGRAPQKTTGVGMVAAGLVDAGAGYLRRVEGDAPGAWALDGVDLDEFGWAATGGGGAASLEIDCTDPELGTPDATVVIASSAGLHNDDMLEARENYGMTLAAPGGARNPRVRSDLVLVPATHGGGVFSTGSIGWAGGLAHDEAISRIFANVLNRFLSGAPVL